MVLKKWHWVKTVITIIVMTMMLIGALLFFAVIFPELSYPIGYLIGFIILFSGALLTIVVIGDIFMYIFKIKGEEKE